MRVARTRSELRDALPAGARIGFVPTMGFLHEGHLSLVERARARGDFVALSIFVNPLQFAPGEDLANYPRALERDLELARARGVDLVFAPDEDEMYPAGEPAVRVVAPRLADRLCGAFRPGHFDGVLTVVAKLFHLVQPAVAVFGGKDFQQSVLVKRMVLDLDLPIEIDVAPTVREPDGLALSSRNAYLSESARASALALSRALFRADDAFVAGETSADVLVRHAREVLASEPGVQPQYVELVHPETLDAVRVAEAGHVLALAAMVDGTRLIDNVVLGTTRVSASGTRS